MDSRGEILAALVLLLCVSIYCNSKQACKSKYGTIACTCGNGKNVLTSFKLCESKNPLSGKIYCEFCGELEIREKLCEKFKNCQTCVNGTKRCSSCPSGKSGRFCLKVLPGNGLHLNEKDMRLIKDFFSLVRSRNRTDLKEKDIRQVVQTRNGIPLEAKDFPIRVNISSGGNSSRGNEKLHRYIRDNKGACKMPTGITTADLDCTIWPSHLQCVEMCMFGYTLPGGLTQAFTCELNENKWKPHEMRDCKPYIDCNIILNTPGKMNCTHGDLNKGTECAITCYSTKEHKRVERNKHQCDEKGNWVPELPFCIAKASSD